MSTLDGTQRFSRPLIILFNVLLVVLVGFLDVATGWELNLGVFFLLPIGWITWSASKQAGLALAAISALLWPVMSLFIPHALPELYIIYWNALVRFVLLAVAVYGLLFLKRRQQLELKQSVVKLLNQERAWLSQDLHDTVVQDLVGMRMLALRLKKNLEAQTSSDAAMAEELAMHLSEAHQQARRIMQGLKPMHLEADSLVPALERACQNLERWYSFTCRVQAEVNPTLRDAYTAEQLFLIAHEAMLNAAKHSKGAGVTVSLHASKADLVLEVKDDGMGLADDHALNGGSGLRSMRQRAYLIGASFEVLANTPNGTIIRCILRNYAFPSRTGSQQKARLRPTAP